MAGNRQEILVKKGSNVVDARVEKGEVGLTSVDNAFFNYLLARAQTDFANEFLNAKVHSIPMKDALSFMSADRPAKIKDSIDRLCQANIRVDYSDGEEVRSLSCHLLSMDYSQAADGFLHFAFDPILWHFIKDPKVFALINIDRVRDIRHLPGQRLYEHMELVRRKRNPEWTVSIEDLREIFDAAESYPRFDNFRRNVIEKAVDAVNSVAPYDVLVEYTRAGRGGSVVTATFRPANKGHHRLVEASAIRATGVRSRVPKDMQTIDFLDGKTAEERGGPAGRHAEVSAGALERAAEIIQDDRLPEEYYAEWMSSSKGKLYSDPDRAFIAWLEMKVEQSNNPILADIDDDVFGALLDGGA